MLGSCSEEGSSNSEIEVLTTETQIQAALMEYAAALDKQAMETMPIGSLSGAANSADNFETSERLRDQLELSIEFMSEEQKNVFEQLSY